MDTSLIILGVMVLVAIVSLVFGVLSFIKYSKTGKKKFLWLGILLTFIIPGILIYLAFRFYIVSTAVVYAPYPGPDNGMVYMPGPA